MFWASPLAALALATINVAPSVTRAAAVVVAGAAVVAAAPPAAVVVAPAAVVVEPSVSTPPASLLSMERKMRKPTTTAITASTIVSGDPTGEPESPTRVDVRPRSVWAPTPPGSVGSLIAALPWYDRRSALAVGADVAAGSDGPRAGRGASLPDGQEPRPA